MTREEILALEAGEELEQLVATKVMGWRPHKLSPNVWMMGPKGEYRGHTLKGSWRPSRDISAAWEVVEKLRAEGWAFTIDSINGQSGGWFVGLDHESNPYKRTLERGETAPLVISRAALLAVMEGE